MGDWRREIADSAICSQETNDVVVAKFHDEAYIQARQPGASDKTGMPKPDDSPLDHLGKAHPEMDDDGKLTPAARREFEAAIRAADKVDPKEIEAQRKIIEAQIDAMYTPETSTVLMAALAAEAVPRAVEEADMAWGFFENANPERQAEVFQMIEQSLSAPAKILIAERMLVDKMAACHAQLNELDDLSQLPMTVRLEYLQALKKSGDSKRLSTVAAELTKRYPQAVNDERYRNNVGIYL